MFVPAIVLLPPHLNLLLFFLYRSSDHRAPHSFPTRRSSDLKFRDRSSQPDSASTQSANRSASRTASRIRDRIDRKSTRLNSSHRTTSYAVFCLKKNKSVIN